MFFGFPIILGIIQGIGEFLPISSSSHIIFFCSLLGYKGDFLPLEVGLHAGTLLAVIFYNRTLLEKIIKDGFQHLFSGFAKKYFTLYAQLGWMIVVSTLPVIISGYLIKKFLPIDHAPLFILGINNIVFGVLLYWAEKRSKQNKNIVAVGEINKSKTKAHSISMRDAFLIGLGQSLAVIPGVSRLGACLTTMLALNINRLDAIRYAFLLSIPSVLGSVTLTFFDVLKSHRSLDWSAILIGAAVSMVVGIGVIHWIISFLQKHSLKVFSMYRIIFGCIIILRLFF